MSTQIQSAPADDEISLLDLLLVLLKHKRLVLGLPILAATLAAAVGFVMPNQYTATLKVTSVKSPAHVLWVLKSEALSSDVAQKLELQKQFGLTEHSEIISAIASRANFVSNAKEASVDVLVTDKDPAWATKLANAMGESMVEKLIQLRLTETSRQLSDMRAKREIAQKNIQAAQQELKNPELAKGVAAISLADRYGIDNMAAIRAEQSLQSPARLGAPVQQSQTIQSAQPDIAQGEMVRLQEQVAILQRMLAPASRSKQPSLSPAIQISALDQYQKQAYWSALAERLDRQIDLLNKQEREEIKLIPAEIPKSKSGPKRAMLILLAGIGGLFLACVSAFVLEAFRKSQADQENSQRWAALVSAWKSK